METTPTTAELQARVAVLSDKIKPWAETVEAKILAQLDAQLAERSQLIREIRHTLALAQYIGVDDRILAHRIGCLTGELDETPWL